MHARTFRPVLCRSLPTCSQAAKRSAHGFGNSPIRSGRVGTTLRYFRCGGAALSGLLFSQSCFGAAPEPYSHTHKPVLHGRHWVAITGKPLGATAGARIFEGGGNAVDAACAMLAVVCTMYDDLSWGGETQALIYDPQTKKVVGINALGVAPTGATPEFFKKKKLKYPPAEGPLAALTPGSPGGLMVMLAEYGTFSLKQVLEPAMQMADGYPIEAEAVRKIERYADKLKQWPYSKKVFFPHSGQEHDAPRPGEIWRQPELLATLQKLVDAEQQALKAGKSRKAAIYAAYDRFYKGDIAEEYCRASRELGGLHTLADLANWKVKIEEPVMTTYKGIEVYKLTCWTQGPVLLEALNLLENLEVQPMGYDSARYLHALYQVMNLAYADRDFYYGDPDFPPEEPIRPLLSKEYAKQRFKLIDWDKNNPDIRPGDPYAFEGKPNPFLNLLTNWSNVRTNPPVTPPVGSGRLRWPRGSPPSGGPGVGSSSLRTDNAQGDGDYDEAFRAGTTSIQAADDKGWAISVTPSGGWQPACIAGNTGIGMSQRMQSFVLDKAENPFNVLAPGKRPRVTLTPSLALKDGKLFLCFSVQGGDTQDQNLLQFFLNVVEFGMTVQEACEAANMTSYQMRSSFGEHKAEPGRVTLTDEVPSWVRRELTRMRYKLEFVKKNSGPITAIYFDQEHGTFWGGASNHGEDYGIVW
ncbi:MAG: gamma-glutamyltransferase family protein [Verrucomicrobia bacterium]|nr:MAG: gamma-glutamyltransferase family protein [Verrucomicrobiota bacterium]